MYAYVSRARTYFRQFGSIERTAHEIFFFFHLYLCKQDLGKNQLTRTPGNSNSSSAPPPQPPSYFLTTRKHLLLSFQPALQSFCRPRERVPCTFPVSSINRQVCTYLVVRCCCTVLQDLPVLHEKRLGNTRLLCYSA